MKCAYISAPFLSENLAVRCFVGYHILDAGSRMDISTVDGLQI